MTKNLGIWDRIIRVVVGLVLIALAMTHMVPQWGWLGLVPILSAIIGWCPAYTLLGFSTCPSKG